MVCGEQNKSYLKCQSISSEEQAIQVLNHRRVERCTLIQSTFYDMMEVFPLLLHWIWLETINNLSFPVDKTAAVNRDYVDTKLNHLDEELRYYIDRFITEKVTEVVGQMFNSNTVRVIQQ